MENDTSSPAWSRSCIGQSAPQLSEFGRRRYKNGNLGPTPVFYSRGETVQTNGLLQANPRRAAKMSRIKRILSSTCLAASFLIAVASSGCAARVRVYDEYHSDYHTWDRNEDVVYRSYWGERHEPYRDYNKLNKDEQKDYWNWRHDHPDKH
jgi:hypothetical protein